MPNFLVGMVVWTIVHAPTAFSSVASLAQPCEAVAKVRSPCIHQSERYLIYPDFGVIISDWLLASLLLALLPQVTRHRINILTHIEDIAAPRNGVPHALIVRVDYGQSLSHIWTQISPRMHKRTWGAAFRCVPHLI